MVNSRDARLLGPRNVRSCQWQVIPGEGGVTTRTSNTSLLTSRLVGLLSFDLEEKDIFEAQYFRGMYYQKSIASLVAGIF
jgi:hypothetical protein